MRETKYAKYLQSGSGTNKDLPPNNYYGAAK